MKAILAGVSVLVGASALMAAMFHWGGVRVTSATGAADQRPKSETTSAAATVHAPALSKAGSAQSVSASEPVVPAAAPQSKREGNLEQRIAALEAKVKVLQDALNGVSIEKASAERQAMFAADEGYLKADEYFEAGKYAIAGEGYLTFLQNHPEHADAREVMKKARDAFLRAGYKDKAFWVHEEMMKTFPKHQAGDLWEQAQLEKEAGLYDRAVDHAAQAAELAPNPEERLWRRLYWAWYVQLRDGSTAGIAALQ
ncbi:MAG TPA: hypothetical protein VD994_00490, partial [Prosthecobacter sp.]|nr:hypothetical protein [Prosthecobacter sp.]